MPAAVRRTTCSRDCPDACGILATVDDGRVTFLRGDPEHPVTRGFLCFRTSRFLDLQYGPDRLTHPLLRRDGRLEQATWDEVLAAIAKKLRQVKAESGPAAIFHYRSGGSLGILKQLTDAFFDTFGPCTGKVGDICSGAGEAAQLEDLGTSDSNDLFDLLNSRHVLLWGKNPTVSNVHLLPVLKDAQARGARLVLIDPVHHKTAHHADRFLQPAPGTDFELAMGVAAALFESGRTDPDVAATCANLPAFVRLVRSRSVTAWARAADLAEADVRFLADCLADGPTAILVGWGMQRRQRGAAIVRALDALAAVSGNLFRSGGGVSFYFKRRRAFAALGPKVQHPRVIREPLLGRDLLAAEDPPVRFLWVTAGNPVAMLPDAPTVAAAIERTEFVVVADCFLTDTARRAHVVLPVPTLLEDSDVLGAFGHHWLAESSPVVPPPKDVRHEVTIFQDLARRLGLASYPQGPLDDLKRAALADVAGRGAGLEDLRALGAVRSPVSPKVLFGERKVATADGKVRLIDAEPPPAEIAPPPPLPGASAPLWLFSNSTERSQGSIWSGKPPGERAPVTVHPDAVPGRREGEVVRVFSAHGAIEAELRFDSKQRHDVAIVPKGGHYDRGHSANALIAARPTDLGLGAAYLDCLVRIATSR